MKRMTTTQCLDDSDSPHGIRQWWWWWRGPPRTSATKKISAVFCNGNKNITRWWLTSVTIIIMTAAKIFHTEFGDDIRRWRILSTSGKNYRSDSTRQQRQCTPIIPTKMTETAVLHDDDNNGAWRWCTPPKSTMVMATEIFGNSGNDGIRRYLETTMVHFNNTKVKCRQQQYSTDIDDWHLNVCSQVGKGRIKVEEYQE